MFGLLQAREDLDKRIFMGMVWNEALSDELKKLNAIAHPTPAQKRRIATLKGVKATSTGTSKEAQNATSLKGAINTKTGAIDPVKLGDVITSTANKDVQTTFNLSNPGQETDAFGNTKVVTVNPDGTVSTKFTAGGASQAFTNAALSGVQGYQPVNLSGAPIVSGGTPQDRQRAEEAAYNVLTRFTDRDRSRELEEAKQELANRGIPYNPNEAYNPNTKNLFGKTIGAINQKYDLDKEQAALRAAGAGNEFMLANTQASNTANQAFVNSALGQNTANLQGINTLGQMGQSFAGANNTGVQGVQSNNAANLLGIAQMTVQQIMDKYQVDQATAIAMKNKGGGGGGGQRSSGNSNASLDGGLAPGWSV